MGKPASGQQDVMTSDTVSKAGRGSGTRVTETYSGELTPVSSEGGANKGWFRSGSSQRRQRFATVGSLKMARELAALDFKNDMQAVMPDGVLARANFESSPGQPGSMLNGVGSARLAAGLEAGRLPEGLAERALVGGSGPLKPGSNVSFESDASPPWFRSRSARSSTNLTPIVLPGEVDSGGESPSTPSDSFSVSSKSARGWGFKVVKDSPPHRSKTSLQRTDSGESVASDGTQEQKRAGSGKKGSSETGSRVDAQKWPKGLGPPPPPPEVWAMNASMKGSARRPKEKPPKTKASPKAGRHAYPLHESSTITGDFLGLVSELSKEGRENGAHGAEREDRGSSEGSLSPSPSMSSMAGKQRSWSWRKMAWKKNPATKGRQDDIAEHLEQRLDLAKATLSAYQDRTPLEDAAELPEEAIPDVDEEEVVLGDLPPELALPSAPSIPSPLRSPLGREQRLGGDTDEDTRSGASAEDGSGPREASLLAILGATTGKGSATSDELPATQESPPDSRPAPVPQHGEGNMNLLLRELERMRKKAEVAEQARMAAEEKALKALANADRSLRDIELAKRRREMERASNWELATQDATAAIKTAEEARWVALAEAKNTEEALAQAAIAWAGLEAEARKRQEAEELEALSKPLYRPYRLYTWEELQTATNNFAEDRKVGEGGFGTVYSGTLHHTKVAVKVLKNKDGTRAATEFQQEVDVLGEIHHPHMVMLLGCCPERFCLVYEFMANGSLEDRLLCTGGTPPLPWFVRLRICAEVASALLVLHTRPIPIVHRDLKPANVLLDKNLVARLGDVGLARIMPALDGDRTYMRESQPVGTFAYVDPEFQRTGEFGPKSDVYAFGIMLLDVLTGRKPHIYEGVEEAVDGGHLDKLATFLDPTAGDWPVALAMEVAGLAVRCSEMRRKKRPDLASEVMPQLDKIRTYALAAEDEARNRGMASPAPSCLYCPIAQEIMQDPVIAADGYTYEHVAIEQWLRGNDRSPMTSARLPHKDLVPNHAVRTMITEWAEAQFGVGIAAARGPYPPSAR